MEEFESNSHKSKMAAEERKLEPVVTGATSKKKKSEWSKIKNQLISEDASNIKTYLLSDVLIPAIKKTVVDLVKQAIDILVYGKSTTAKTSSASKISYRSYYDDPKPTNNINRGVLDYDEITFENKADAESVLISLNDIIDQYGIARIGDLYELSNIPFTDYQVNSYGWKNLSNAAIVRYRDGYLLRLPRALPIN